MLQRDVILTGVVAVLAVTSAALAGVTLDLRGDLEETRDARDDARRDRWGIQERLNRTFAYHALQAGQALRNWDEARAPDDRRVLDRAEENLLRLRMVLPVTAPTDPQTRSLWSGVNATVTNLVNLRAAGDADLANRTTLIPYVAGVGNALHDIGVALYPERYGEDGDGSPPTLQDALQDLHGANAALERNLTPLLDPVARDRAELLHGELTWTRNTTGASTDDGGGGGGEEGDDSPPRPQPCDPSTEVLEPSCPVANLTVSVKGTLPGNLTGQDATWGLVACPSHLPTHPGYACYSTAERATVGAWGSVFPNVTRVNDHTVRVTVPLDLVDHDRGLLVETRSKLGTHLYRDRCLLPTTGVNATCLDAVDDTDACTQRFLECLGDGDGSTLVDLGFQPHATALENGTLRGTVTLHHARGDGGLRFLPLEPEVTLHANVSTPEGKRVTWTGSSFGEPEPYTNADLIALPPGERATWNVTWPGTWLTEPNATYVVTVTYVTGNDADVTDAHWTGTVATGPLALET